MNFVSWLKDIVYGSTISATNYGTMLFAVFGCVLVAMTVGFIFKFLLKLME